MCELTRASGATSASPQRQFGLNSRETRDSFPNCDRSGGREVQRIVGAVGASAGNVLSPRLNVLIKEKPVNDCCSASLTAAVH